MKTKKCSKCGEIKSLDRFYKQTLGKDGFTSWCKDCLNKQNINWQKNHPEKTREYSKRYYKDNPEKMIERRKKRKKYLGEYLKEWQKDNREKCCNYAKEYYKRNPDKERERIRKWHKNNPEKIRECNKRFRENNKLSRQFSELIRCSLKDKKKGIYWEIIVGFTLQKLINHLENKFKEGMTWDNYGKNGWEIDHIRPISSFNFNSYKDKEFKECWSLENLQPLWASENRSKGIKAVS